MSKWVAERMCCIAEKRGLPISVLRPGNMAGSSATGAQNPDDFVRLFVSGMLKLGCAPDADMANLYFFDLTPVDFAAAATVHIAVRHPARAIGHRMHLQSPHKPPSLGELVSHLRSIGHEWVTRLQQAASKERASAVDTSPIQQLESGFEAFEKYFQASQWLRFDSKNLMHGLRGSNVACPALDQELLAKWFPATKNK